MCIRLPVEDGADAVPDDLPLVALVDALVEVLIKAEPEERWEPVHRWRQAEPGDAEACLGPVSIWDVALLAAVPEAQPDLFGGTEFAPPAPLGDLVQDSPHHKTVDTVQRLKGRTVVSGLAYPSARWTDERAEAERVRRMLQTPPKRPSTAGGFKFGKGA